MEREIKFRAWFWDGIDTSKGAMIDATEAYKENYCHFVGKGELKPTDNCTILMQYTGLKDSKGNEIYEGDLVDSGHGRLGEVVYHEDRAMFIIHDKDNYNEPLYHFSDLQITGNIYEN